MGRMMDVAVLEAGTLLCERTAGTGKQQRCALAMAALEGATMETEVTRLLASWRAGDPAAFDDLFPLVYDKLRALARLKLSDEAPGHTLRSTELVHEAYAKLAGANIDCRDRAHFFAIAGRAMRQILVEHARRRRSQKRGAGGHHQTLDGDHVADNRNDELLIELDEAMSRLAGIDERQARVVELHLFAGLTYAETASVLGVSAATVDRDLRLARAWLASQLAPVS
jgi:RNA polymerase sigma factor (TIGR02999 family)